MLDEELWLDFIQHRKDIKRPLSAVAEKRMLAKILRFMEQGQDVNAMLEKSILNGWQDIYPPKAENKPLAHRMAEIPETPIFDREAAREQVQKAMRKLKVV